MNDGYFCSGSIQKTHNDDIMGEPAASNHSYEGKSPAITLVTVLKLVYYLHGSKTQPWQIRLLINHPQLLTINKAGDLP